MRNFHLAVILVFIFVVGCATQPQSQKSRFEADILAYRQTNYGSINDIPIIDIHTHTFNARYLPLRNIVLGKRDFNFFGLFVDDRSAENIAAVFTNETDLTSLDGDMPAYLAYQAGKKPADIQAQIEKSKAAKSLYDAITKYKQDLIEQRDSDTFKGLEEKEAYSKRQALLDERFAQMKKKDLKKIRKALRAFGFMLDFESISRFVRYLISPDGDQHLNYANAFQNNVALMVSLTMDLAPVYDQEEKNNAPLVFETEQIRRMEVFQDMEDSRMIYFVAYNPFRDHWAKGNPYEGKSLDIVKNAIEHHGAYGVKFYPASGYRPRNNKIPGRPFAIFTKAPGRQYEARYKHITNCDFDRRIWELLDWCEDNNIPVMAHCSTKEVEARKGYGVKMSHPKFWRDYLEAKSRIDKRPCRLRLCLAHAGGSSFWFGQENHKEWGEMVLELCKKYPNVYCDISVHDEIEDLQKREYFIQLLESHFMEEDNGNNPKGYFPFSHKIMFGTDWFMPVKISPEVDYLYAYQMAFLDPRIKKYYRNFFFENAMHFLDVEGRLSASNHSFSTTVENRLKELVEIKERLNAKSAQ